MAAVSQSTLQERETLMVEARPKRTGFTPRPIEKLTSQKLPKDVINLEISHRLRSSTEGTTHGNPQLQYRLWLEAGKQRPPFPERPDNNYNSNVWRNFRREFGFYTDADGQKVTEMIANMYPINIPPPSRIGSQNYKKFLKETPMMGDDKLKEASLKTVEADLDEFYRLRLHSDLRNPPIDEQGQIQPPKFFKKYAPKFIAPDEDPYKRDVQVNLFEKNAKIYTDIFGQRVPRKRPPPSLWKLSYKLNNPQYACVQEEIMRRKAQSTQRHQQNHPDLTMRAFHSERQSAF